MKKYFLVIILISIFWMGKNTFSQPITEMNYGFQGDLSAGILNAKISGAVDLDFINIKRTFYLGTRVSAEYYSKGGVEGQFYDSPYTDLDVLAKFTYSNKFVEINLCPGITYHYTSLNSKYIFLSKNTNYYPDKHGWYSKLAGDFKFKIYKDYFGLLIKFAVSKEGYNGIGIFFGGNSRDS